jgi:integrase
MRGNGVPTYRLHRADGRAVVTLDGHDVYLGPHGSDESKAEYRRVIGEWLASGRVPQRANHAALKVNEVILAYWRHAKDHYRKDGEPTSEQHLVRGVLSFVRAPYGATQAVDFGPLQLRAVRELMVKKGWVRRTINGHVGRIRRMFKWAVGMGMLPGSVYHALTAIEPLKRDRTAAKDRPPIRPVAEAGVLAILPHVSRQVATMIQLQLATGMRSGEVVLMRPMDIDRSGPIWIYQPSRHKTEHHGKARSVLIRPADQHLLEPYLERGPDQFMFSPAEAMAELRARRRETRVTPMTPSQAARAPRKSPRKAPGQRYENTSYGRAIAVACKRAGVPHWHPQQLRHAAADRFRDDYGIDLTQALLGHSSVRTTENYAQADLKKTLRVMDSIDRGRLDQGESAAQLKTPPTPAIPDAGRGAPASASGSAGPDVPMNERPRGHAA